MQNHKIKSYIGFAVKSNNVVFGLDNIMTSRVKVRVIIEDGTLGEASKRKLTNFLAHKDIPVVVLSDISLGSDILKRDKCKIIGVLEDNLAKAIIAEAKA